MNQDECNFAAVAQTNQDRPRQIALAKAQAEGKAVLADLAGDLHGLAEIPHWEHVSPSQLVDEMEQRLHAAFAKLPELRKAAKTVERLTPVNRFPGF